MRKSSYRANKSVSVIERRSQYTNTKTMRKFYGYLVEISRDDGTNHYQEKSPWKCERPD